MSTTTITAPCVVAGMSDEDYHADPVPAGSLSSTGARRIFSSPARFAWEQQHRVEKPEFDLGHAVHAKVLGTGMQTVTIPDDLLGKGGSVSTSAAKAFVAEARAQGLVPLKAEVLAQVDEMAEAVLTHRTARLFLERPGIAEASAFAIDPVTGEWMRARPDFLPVQEEKRRTILVDLKTARSADPREFRRSVATFGYHQQHAWYADVLRAARGDTDVAMVFVVVEVEPPYLVSVCEVIDEHVQVGRDRNRAALDLWHECRQTGKWPGYGESVHPIDLPVWALYEAETVL